jgi:prepilin signal peptidase PulO-like enzyme (type II secretory pathway)
MKTKHTIIIFAIGVSLSLIGAFCKLEHLPFGVGNIILGIATLMESIGLILFLYKILTNPKLKDFLNW